MDKWNLFFSIVETLKIGTMEIGDPMDVEDIKEKYFILVDIASSIEAFLEDQEKLFNFGREISLSRRSDSSLTREEWDSLQKRLNNVQYDPELAKLYSEPNDEITLLDMVFSDKYFCSTCHLKWSRLLYVKQNDEFKYFCNACFNRHLKIIKKESCIDKIVKYLENPRKKDWIASKVQKVRKTFQDLDIENDPPDIINKFILQEDDFEIDYSVAPIKLPKKKKEENKDVMSKMF